jgi:hypothetical protein
MVLLCYLILFENRITERSNSVKSFSVGYVGDKKIINFKIRNAIFFLTFFLSMIYYIISGSELSGSHSLQKNNNKIKNITPKEKV